MDVLLDVPLRHSFGDLLQVFYGGLKRHRALRRDQWDARFEVLIDFLPYVGRLAAQQGCLLYTSNSHA